MEKLNLKNKKTIALVAHDNRKQDLVEWISWNYDTVLNYNLVSTGTTGKVVEEELTRKIMEEDNNFEINITKLKSGPLGGDQQLGSLIVDGKIDLFIFFWDPMQPHPHDVDVKALLRIAVLYNIPMACNRSTADYMISSSLMDKNYQRVVKDYSSYINREI